MNLDHIRRALTLRRERFAKNGQRVLDVGVGDHKRGNVGLDIVPGPEVDVVADATQMPFPENSFDAVICYHLVEHLDTKAFALLMANCKYVLKPEGRMHLLVDRDESFEALMAKDPTHFERYSPQFIEDRFRFYFEPDVFQTHNLIGNVHNHPLRWPLLLSKATKVYAEGTPRR